MKITGKCQKCGCTDILRINCNVGAYGSGNNIHVGLTNFSAVKVNRIHCKWDKWNNSILLKNRKNYSSLWTKWKD